MRFRGYKQLLEHINKDTHVMVVISLWTYSSKRIRCRVLLDDIKKYFDHDMIHDAYNKRMVFKATDGKEYKFREHTVKICKVDYIEY